MRRSITTFGVALVAAFLAVVLAACGGGGGGGAAAGGGASGAAVVFNPSPVSANFMAGTSATLTLRATAPDPAIFTGAVYIYIVDSKQVLTTDVNITGVDETTFAATLHTSAALPIGRHQGSFEVQLCKDANCAAQYPGSPVALPYDFTVTAAPLRATATASTAATVHWGGVVASAATVNVSGPALDWAASTSAGWLRLSGLSGNGSGTFTVFYSAVGLAVGSYADKVTVRSSDAQTVEIPFTLEVLPTQFVITSGVPSFSAVNGTTIAAQPLSFELDSKAASPWTASTTAAWLSASALSGTTPASLTLQPNPSQGALASGAHSAGLVLSSTGIASRTVTTNLTLIRPALSAPAAAVTLGGAKGREPATAQSLAVSLNTGANAWPFALSALPAWLQSSTPSGTLSQSGTPLNYAANLAKLAAGSVSATVTVSASVNGDTVTLPLTVNLNVDQRRLLPSEWGVAFASTPTGTVLTRTVTLADNFGGALPWAASSDAAWLSVTASGTTGNPGTSSATLVANPALLPAGVLSYANVSFSSGTPGVEPAVVRVALWKNTSGLASIVKLPLDYSQIVADKIRPFIYATNGGTGVDIFHAYSAQLVGSMANVGTALGAMSVSPDGARLYVLDTATRNIAVVDLATNTKTASWPLVNAVNAFTSLLAIRPNGVEVVLLGDGTAYTQGRSLGNTGISGTITASSDGRKVFTQNSGLSPASVAAFDVDFSAMSGGLLMVSRVANASFINGSSNGADIAANADASGLITASGAPYLCSRVNPGNLSFNGSLQGGDAYPNNVEFTRDGRAICGIFGWYSTADFWVHSASGVLQQSHRVAGYAKALKTGQLVVSGDGFVVVALSDDPLIAFVPIGP